MRAPFQRLLFTTSKEAAVSRLVGAAGGSLSVFDVTAGQILSRWNAQSSDDETARSTKRRRIGVNEGETTEAASAKSPKAIRNQDGISQQNGYERSFITNLIGTSDGQRLVATTAQDKLVYVFQLHQDGTLSQLSRRQMAKRPCAITLTPDERSIVCADRFGDVYSLPLEWNQDEWDAGKAGRSKSPERRRRLAADHTNVHSKKNIQALKNQVQQQNKDNKESKEPVMDFEHDLLLGHVSMLTDVTMAEVSVSNQSRRYIFTADRDEHIRLSRGPPQSFVIEKFLLKHTEIVNKLHIPCWDSKLLISGGGDNYVVVWDWLGNKVLQRLDIKSHLEAARKSIRVKVVVPEPSKDFDTKVMVTGLWSLRVNGSNMLIVSCEAVPALLLFTADGQGVLRYKKTLLLAGNILDVAVSGDCALMLSLDHIHVPWTRDESGPSKAQVLLTYIEHDFESGSSEEPIGNHLEDAITEAAEVAAPEDALYLKELRDLLYGCEKLRKRRHGGSEAASDESAGEPSVD